MLTLRLTDRRKNKNNAMTTQKTMELNAPAPVRVQPIVGRLTAEEKLKLIELPARRCIKQLRILADSDLGFEDEGRCTMSNLAGWLEGVLDEADSYMPWCSETAKRALNPEHIPSGPDATKP